MSSHCCYNSPFIIAIPKMGPTAFNTSIIVPIFSSLFHFDFLNRLKLKSQTKINYPVDIILIVTVF